MSWGDGARSMTAPSYSVQAPDRLNRRRSRGITIAVTVAALLAVGGLGGVPWVLRRYEIRKFHAWLAEGERAAILEQTPSRWEPEASPTGHRVDLGFAEFQLAAPLADAPERRASTAVLLRAGEQGEVSVMFMGALRTALRGNQDQWYELAGEQAPPSIPRCAAESRMWSEMLAIVGTTAQPDGVLAGLERGPFTVYKLRAMFKATLHPDIEARLGTPRIDSLIARVRDESGDGYHATIVSRDSDIGIGVYVQGPTRPESERILRHMLSSFRFQDSGWKGDEELEVVIDKAIGGSQRP